MVDDAKLPVEERDEAFEEELSVFFGCVGKLGPLPGVEGERFVAEDVFSGVEGIAGPLGVEGIWQADEDGVDFGVVEEFAIGAEGAWNVEVMCPLFGLGQLAAGDGGDLAEGGGANGGDPAILSDAGAAEDAPADRFGLGVHHGRQGIGRGNGRQGNGPSDGSRG